MTSSAFHGAASGAQVLAAEDLSGFGTDPWWLILIKVLFIFVFLVLSVLLTMWAERRILGRMQLRLGPNRHGPLGLLQGLADGLKLGVKEDLVPKNVDKWVYILAPAAASAPAFISFAIMPFGPQVSIFGQQTHLQLTDLPVAVLLVLAMASMGVYGFVLAGWASGSPFALLGGLRSSAQVISYEIAMALTFVAVFLYAGTLSTSGIVAAQERLWFAVVLIPSFLIYVVTMVGETNRIPFDLPEGEGELVGGYHTEYSSMKFAMFFLAEYVNMSTVCGLSVTLFLGGWRAPAPISTIWPDANVGWWPMLWFVIKFALVMFMFIWLRAALPRIRYDQLMKLGWKVLIPVSIVWIVVVATLRGLRNAEVTTTTWLSVLGVGLVLALVALYLWDRAAEKRREAKEHAKEQEFATLKAKPAAGGFPVPPLRAAHYGSDVRDALEAPRTEQGPSAKEVTGA